MDNEKKQDVEDAPKTAKKSCCCGDLRAFIIALLTSVIVVAGYHIARVTFHQYLRSVRGQQLSARGARAGFGEGGPCCCRCRACRFRAHPRFMPGEPGKPGFGKPFRHGKPGMGKPGFPGKRGRSGKRPMPPKEEAKPAPKSDATEVKPAAPAAKPAAPAAKPAAPAEKK